MHNLVRYQSLSSDDREPSGRQPNPSDVIIVRQPTSAFGSKQNRPWGGDQTTAPFLQSKQELHKVKYLIILNEIAGKFVENFNTINIKQHVTKNRKYFQDVNSLHHKVHFKDHNLNCQGQC